MSVCQEHKELVAKINKISEEEAVMGKEMEYVKERLAKLEKSIDQLRNKVNSMPVKIILGTATLITAINTILQHIVK